MRKRLGKLALGSITTLLMTSMLVPLPAEAGGRRATGVRRVAPSGMSAVRRQASSARHLTPRPAPAQPIRHAQPVRHVQPLSRPVPTPVASRPAHVLRTPTAPAQPRQSGFYRHQRSQRTQAVPSTTTSLWRARHTGARRTTPATLPSARTPRTRPATTPAPRPVATPIPSLRSLDPVRRARNAASLARLRGGAQTPAFGHRAFEHRGAAPAPSATRHARPRLGTPVPSIGDTRARTATARSRSGSQAGPLTRGNLAHHANHGHRTDLALRRARDGRSALRILADRRRTHHTAPERHVAPLRPATRPHRPHRRHRHRPTVGFSNAGIDWSWYWHRHHRPGLGLPVSRTIYVPIPTYPYAPYEPYPVPWSPGYMDDAPYEPHAPYEPAAPGHADYIADEYGPAAEAQQPVKPDAFHHAIDAFRAGRYEDARTHLAEAVKRDRDDGEAWMAIVHVGFLLGHYDEAAVALTEAARLGAFPRGYRFDARQLFEDPRVFDEALERLHKHARLRPRDPAVWIVRAYFHVALGEREAAQAAIHHVLLLRRADPVAPVLNNALLPALDTPTTRSAPR